MNVTRHVVVLLVLFIPATEKDGRTRIDQPRWVTEALHLLARLYGGATAFTQATSVWGTETGHPVVIHCYARAGDAEDETRRQGLLEFCERLGRQTNQREVDLVIGDEHVSLRDF